MADVDVDRARLPVVGPSAQALEQLAAREHDAGALREHDEHLELDERQLHGLAAHVDRSARNVDAKLTALDELLALARRGAATRRGGEAPARGSETPGSRTAS